MKPQNFITETNPEPDSWVKELYDCGLVRLQNFVPMPSWPPKPQITPETKRIFKVHQGRPIMAVANKVTIYPKHNWHLIAIGGSIKAACPLSLAERIVRRLFAVPKGDRL